MSNPGWEQPVEQVDPTCLALAEEYDAKINALYVEIRNLRASRNSKCSATRNLPAAVLLMVFRRLPTTNNTRRRFPSCINVTHVCRAWRTAALDEPMLWNDTTSLSTRWLELTLRRAAAAPLKVKYPCKRPKYLTWLHDSPSDSSLSLASSYSSSESSIRNADGILEKLFDTPEQLGELELGYGSDEVISRLTRAAPFLSALRLSGEFSVPSDFLGNSAPRLRTFSSNGCSFPMDVTWLRNLSTLVLVGRWGFKGKCGNDIAITTASFLGVIRPLEKLENLTVDFLFIEESAFQDYTGGVVRFPSLRTSHFSFRGESSVHLVNLFTHVQLPSMHSLRVVWPHPPSQENANSLFTSFVSSCSLPFRRVVWDSLAISLHVDSSLGGRTFTFERVFLKSSKELPFQGLETIEELEIRDYWALSLFLSSATSPVPYPSLKRLSFDSSLLNPNRLSRHPNDRSPTPKNVSHLLKSWLKRRKALYNLEKLVISGSRYVTDQDIKAFEKFVPVTWIRDNTQRQRSQCLNLFT